jgi:hypothetical protein
MVKSMLVSWSWRDGNVLYSNGRFQHVQDLQRRAVHWPAADAGRRLLQNTWQGAQNQPATVAKRPGANLHGLARGGLLLDGHVPFACCQALGCKVQLPGLLRKLLLQAG